MNIIIALLDSIAQCHIWQNSLIGCLQKKKYYKQLIYLNARSQSYHKNITIPHWIHINIKYVFQVL